jgi:hypothetical protein
MTVGLTWKKSSVKTSRQLAYLQGCVMYTSGTAVASEQMLSAKIRLWNGPVHAGHATVIRQHMVIAKIN